MAGAAARGVPYRGDALSRAMASHFGPASEVMSDESPHAPKRFQAEQRL